MATAHPLAAQTQMAKRWLWTSTCQFATSVQWHPVSDEDRLPMAHAASYLWLLADRVWLFQSLAKARCFERVQQVLTRRERKRQGRKPTASAGCIDSQSVKTATQGESKGYDAGKKINGRKRHLLVDTLGLVISAFVSPANLQDRDGLKRCSISILTRERHAYASSGLMAAIAVKTSKNGSPIRSKRTRLILRLLRILAKAFRSSNAGGSLSAPLRGYAIFADCQRIMKA